MCEWGPEEGSLEGEQLFLEHHRFTLPELDPDYLYLVTSVIFKLYISEMLFILLHSCM